MDCTGALQMATSAAATALFHTRNQRHVFPKRRRAALAAALQIRRMTVGVGLQFEHPG